MADFDTLPGDAPSVTKTFTSENRGPEAPADLFQAVEWGRDRYNDPHQIYLGKPYFKNSEPDSPLRYALAGPGHINHGVAGDWLVFEIDCYEPSERLDPKTKTMKEHRIRHVGVSSSGEKIFPIFSCDAWRFALEYSPDRSWMTRDEWQRILREELAPIIAEDKRLSEIEQGHIESQNRKLGQAAAARLNPEAALAAGISQGIAEAWRQLGVKPQKP